MSAGTTTPFTQKMAKSRKPEITPDGKFRGVVYCRTHKATGKPYVGETDNEKIRIQCWDKPGVSNYGGSKITEARNTYGIGSDIWEYTILEEITSDSHDELVLRLRERQTFWIKEKDAVENGFNSSYGDGMQGRKHTEESRAKISQNHRKYQSDVTKQKLSKIMKGRTVSDATKAKISARNRGKKRTLEQRQAQSKMRKGKVPQAATDGAKEWLKKNGGGYWKYHPLSDKAKSNMKAAQQKRGTKVQATYPDGHFEDFNTMLDAAKATGHWVGSVYYSVMHGSVTKNNYRFKKL